VNRYLLDTLSNLARGDLDLMLAPMITAWGRKPSPGRLPGT
jgi:hypothetical protein